MMEGGGRQVGGRGHKKIIRMSSNRIVQVHTLFYYEKGRVFDAFAL
jgi:hypothetical protein